MRDNEYRESADKLFQFNSREGRVRGKTILTICKSTHAVAIAGGISLFCLGLVIGAARSRGVRGVETPARS